MPIGFVMEHITEPSAIDSLAAHLAQEEMLFLS
jgi:hypothetical protein